MIKPWCEHWSYWGWWKGTSPDEATLNSEEIKPVAITAIKLHLSEGIREGVSQSAENLLNRKFLKFHNNLMQRFRVDLKTFLCLAMPNQCSQTVRKQISSWFGEIILGQNPQTFLIPIYSTTVLYDKRFRKPEWLKSYMPVWHLANGM